MTLREDWEPHSKSYTRFPDWIIDEVEEVLVVMKEEEIIARLFDNKRGVTPERIAKAQALTSRSKLTWESVLEKMTQEQRQLVNP